MYIYIIYIYIYIYNHIYNFKYDFTKTPHLKNLAVKIYYIRNNNQLLRSLGAHQYSSDQI